MDTAKNSTTGPLVSIGLPTYNRIEYIRDVLDSMLAQTYKNFELVISDNASTDGTEKIVDEYTARDTRIRVIHQKENIDLVPNYNVVLHEAKGKYFMWIADDDMYKPTFIEACVEKLEGDSEAVLAMSGYYRFDPATGEREPNDPKEFFPFERDQYRRLKQFILFSWRGGKPALGYGLYRRSVIDGWSYGRFWGYDLVFLTRALSYGPFLFIPDVLYLKRTRPNSLGAKPQHSLPVRIVRAFWYRFSRLCSPLFTETVGVIVHAPGLSWWKKLKLLFWHCYFFARLFVVPFP